MNYRKVDKVFTCLKLNQEVTLVYATGVKHGDEVLSSLVVTKLDRATVRDDTIVVVGDNVETIVDLNELRAIKLHGVLAYEWPPNGVETPPEYPVMSDSMRKWTSKTIGVC